MLKFRFPGRRDDWRRPNDNSTRDTSTYDATMDPRTAPHFARAARCRALAAAMGWRSLEHAVRAGQMPELLRRVAPSAAPGRANLPVSAP